MWTAEVLIPAHRIVFALRGDQVIELRAPTTAATFGAYRGLPDAVHGMIAWPNTVLLRDRGGRPVVVDPGYNTQGDMLAGALAARGLSPDDVGTALATHLHSDHITALPQLGPVELHVHERELEERHARAQRGAMDAATIRPMTGESGEVLPGVRWILTPGHTEGHVAYLVDTADGVVAIAGDTPGPDPRWLEDMDLPQGHPRREDHLRALRAIRDAGPSLVIPGHNPPQRLSDR